MIDYRSEMRLPKPPMGDEQKAAVLPPPRMKIVSVSRPHPKRHDEQDDGTPRK